MHLSPDRPNLFYSVIKVKRDIHDTFRWLVEELSEQRLAIPRVTIFCRPIVTCTAFYKYFLLELQEASYEPPSTAPTCSTCLFVMYHAKILDEDKCEILSSSLNVQGTCHVLYFSVQLHSVWELMSQTYAL